MYCGKPVREINFLNIGLEKQNKGKEAHSGDN